MSSKVYVISTGLGCDRSRCLESVASQRGVAFEHRWVDAAEQCPPVPAIDNVRALLEGVPDDGIVAWVDLDDRLVRDDALSLVSRAHDRGAWVTWGQFKCCDGRPGFAAPYLPTESVRSSPWRATHLKTWRAGLFRRIRPEHLVKPLAIDFAVMFPCIEMAGMDRCTVISDVLYEYNQGASYEWNADDAGRQAERDAAMWQRTLPPYARLDAL
jgi:hypothetical protein